MNAGTGPVTGAITEVESRPSLGRTYGLVGLFGLLALLAAFTLFSLDLRTKLRRDAQKEIEATSFLLADHASRLFKVADVALHAAAVDIGQTDLAEVAQSKDLYQQLAALNTALPYVEDVWINDDTGLLRLTTFRFPAPFSNAGDRDVFRALRDGPDTLRIGERIVGRVTGRPTFLLARALRTPEGRFRGMVSVTADLRYFNDYWSQARLPPGVRVTLLRAPGFDILAQHPEPGTGAVFVPPPLEPLRAFLAGTPEGGRVEVESSGAESESLEVRHVGTLPLYLCIGTSQASLDRAWRDRVSFYGGFAGAAAAGFLALMIFGFRQARRDTGATQALTWARGELERANSRLERTVAERTEALRASEGRLRLILESATDYAIITTDLGGMVTHWNIGACNLLGWEADAAAGQSLRMIFPPEDQAAGVPESDFGRTLTEGRAADERWYVRRDGSRFFAIGVLLPMRGGADGAPTGFLKVLRDRTQAFEMEEAKRNLNVTLETLVAERTQALEAANRDLQTEARSRARAEEQFRQAQKMEAVGRLTGGVAHDFNNLLTVVKGNLDMLARRIDGSGDERARSLVRRAIEGADRAAALTFRLLAFSRQQPLAPEPLDANRLVAGMSDLLRRTLGESIAIETVLAGGLWQSHADPNQLESALLNLAVNARDAMPEGGKLTIETANAYLDEAYAAGQPDLEPGQYVMIAVCDTGHGMSAEVKVQAFEPFFTTKPVGHGTGLGLSQVYGFAKQSRGHAAIYSEPGEGSTVKIYLPRHRAAGTETLAADAAVLVGPQDDSRGQGETILVVEDDPLVRDFSVTVLEEAGYRVLQAEDGPGGLAALDRSPEARLLFTDVVLTGPMNGRKVADEALLRRPGLGVLFTTGYTRNAIIHHGRLDEGVNLITKPFTATQLLAKIRQILDESGPARAQA